MSTLDLFQVGDDVLIVKETANVRRGVVISASQREIKVEIAATNETLRFLRSRRELVGESLGRWESATTIEQFTDARFAELQKKDRKRAESRYQVALWEWMTICLSLMKFKHGSTTLVAPTLDVTLQAVDELGVFIERLRAIGVVVPSNVSDAYQQLIAARTKGKQ